MRKLILFILFVFCGFSVIAQERIFSIGYGKTFVAKDSTALNITLDLNRIPAQSESSGGYYIINEVFNKSKIGYFLKPTADVNIGSAVSSAPNNVSVGLPVGIVYDIPKTKIGIFSWYFELSPDLVADKEFTNYLYYASQFTYLKYQFLNSNFSLDIISGLSNSNGKREQRKLGTNDSYGRLRIPVYLVLKAANASNKRTVNGISKGKDFKRINLSTVFKYNHVYSDNEIYEQSKDYRFFNVKLDFYLTPNLAINATYNNGYEEPVFKQSNSLLFGITLAR